MTRFLQHLVGRSTAAPELVRPRLPGRFEPLVGEVGLWAPVRSNETVEEIEAEAATPLSSVRPTPRRHPARPAPLSEPQQTVSPALPPVEREPPTQQEPPPRQENDTRSVVSDVVPNRRRVEHSTPSPLIDSPLQSERPEAVSDPPWSMRAEQADVVQRLAPQPAALPVLQVETPRLPPVVPAPKQEPVRALAIEPGVRLQQRQMPGEHPTSEQIVPVTRPPVKSPPPVRTSEAEARMIPTIQVTIGRVEVRAVFAPSAPQSPPPRPAPGLSLDEYLKQRDGGKG